MIHLIAWYIETYIHYWCYNVWTGSPMSDDFEETTLLNTPPTASPHPWRSSTFVFVGCTVVLTIALALYILWTRFEIQFHFCFAVQYEIKIVCYRSNYNFLNVLVSVQSKLSIVISYETSLKYILESLKRYDDILNSTAFCYT